jgi:hypothetical protein
VGHQPLLVQPDGSFRPARRHADLPELIESHGPLPDERRGFESLPPEGSRGRTARHDVTHVQCKYRMLGRRRLEMMFVLILTT